MAKRDNDLERVLRKHRNAIKKVSRLEHKGIRIRHTDENPTLPASEVRNLSPSLRREYERRLDAFTSRQRQYVPGADNQAIRRSSLEAYNRLQEQNNQMVERLEDAVRNLTLPGGDMTVGTLMDMREKLTQKMGSQERFFEKINRTAGQIEGERGIQQAIAELNRRQSSAVISERVEKRLNSIRAALTYSGNVDMVDELDALSLPQQVFLVDYSNFGSIAALNINSPKYSSTGELVNADYEERSGVIEQDPDEIHESLQITLDWVRQNAAATSRAAKSTGRTLRKPRRK